MSTDTLPAPPPLWRIYTLRLCYLILGLGIALAFWPNLMNHAPEFVAARGVQFALLSGIGVFAFLGLRSPLRMLPILLFEFAWKAIYLAAYALPLWRAHQITPDLKADIISIAFVAIFLPFVPWTYAVRSCLLAPGDRWR